MEPKMFEVQLSARVWVDTYVTVQVEAASEEEAEQLVRDSEIVQDHVASDMEANFDPQDFMIEIDCIAEREAEDRDRCDIELQAEKKEGVSQ